jgi:hypothetical protein
MKARCFKKSAVSPLSQPGTSWFCFSPYSLAFLFTISLYFFGEFILLLLVAGFLICRWFPMAFGHGIVDTDRGADTPS